MFDSIRLILLFHFDFIFGVIYESVELDTIDILNADVHHVCVFKVYTQHSDERLGLGIRNVNGRHVVVFDHKLIIENVADVSRDRIDLETQLA
uniref:Uncharacterized protein n=1 Tax=Spodoptera litura multicapsid nucleopolyhedrovirus TaxID=46242 RepID=Q9IK78_NPVST|nr:unknown [Spodoptera litura nucleopolyhedrovirus]